MKRGKEEREGEGRELDEWEMAGKGKSGKGGRDEKGNKEDGKGVRVKGMEKGSYGEWKGVIMEEKLERERRKGKRV